MDRVDADYGTASPSSSTSALASWRYADGVEAILVRIGVDQTYGGWNAPADPDSRRFVYVPIPESARTTFHRGLERHYAEVAPALEAFRQELLHPQASLPERLKGQAIHLDPDFEHLTYGDDGDKRGSHIRRLALGDLLVFYAGLRPPNRRAGGIVYAIVGLLVVDEVLDAESVPAHRWHENAHTRKASRGASDIVVRGRPLVSGRCSRYVPIGEFRDRAYRVRDDVLDAWGGLSVRNGYIQRSARPPRFLDAKRFFGWWNDQGIELVRNNFQP